jgi:hypothetical protein
MFHTNGEYKIPLTGHPIIKAKRAKAVPQHVMEALGGEEI